MEPHLSVIQPFGVLGEDSFGEQRSGDLKHNCTIEEQRIELDSMQRSPILLFPSLDFDGDSDAVVECSPSLFSYSHG